MIDIYCIPLIWAMMVRARSALWRETMPGMRKRSAIHQRAVRTEAGEDMMEWMFGGEWTGWPEKIVLLLLDIQGMRLGGYFKILHVHFFGVLIGLFRLDTIWESIAVR